jgi:von Willebrand factor type A domain
MQKGWVYRRPWIIFTTLALLSLPVKAKAESRVELILDASGSMWAKAGSEEKITAAKRIVKEWLKDAKLSSDSQLGLTAYGHRDKDDCKDIERFPTVSYEKRASLIPVIDKLSPKGKTPIADTLTTVGESLKSYEGATSILLVSDGIESCGKDPCAVAHQLREQYGVNVTIHVVGFDVGDGRPQLECIAREGGGKYFNASDAKELATAFEDVKAELIKADTGTKSAPSPPPSVEKTTKVIKLPGVGTLEFKSHQTGMVEIFDQQTGEKRGSYCNGCGSNTQVPAGTYKLKFPNFVAEGVEVGPGEKKVFDLNSVAGTLEFKSHQTGMVEIFDQQTGEKRGSYCNGCGSNTQVPAGTYKLKFPNFTVNDVVVKAGQEVVLE